MELKKNPNVDPRRNSMLFFQVGLVAVLLISFIGIELKSEDPRDEKIDEFVTSNLITEEEEAIVTLPPVQSLPPPPPPAPEVIEVVKDEIKLEEKKIEVTEVQENKPVVVVAASAVGGTGDGEVEFDGELPFAVLEDIPLFPGCETVPKAKREECFNDMMNKHIKKNFNYPSKAAEDNVQGQVVVQFVIDKSGNIIDITPKFRGKGDGALLEKEASRIISKLPKFTPGKQRNKPVKVKYAQPIQFRLN